MYTAQPAAEQQKEEQPNPFTSAPSEPEPRAWQQWRKTMPAGASMRQTDPREESSGNSFQALSDDDEESNDQQIAPSRPRSPDPDDELLNEAIALASQ